MQENNDIFSFQKKTDVKDKNFFFQSFLMKNLKKFCVVKLPIAKHALRQLLVTFQDTNVSTISGAASHEIVFDSPLRPSG